jgi:type I restriction enzyme S subunit
MASEWTTHCNLGDISVFSQGLQVPTPNQHEENNGERVPFLRISDYTSSADPRYIDPPKNVSRYWIESEDVTMVRYGDTGFVGRNRRGVIANNLFKITPDTQIVEKAYLYYFLKQESVYNFIKAVTTSAGLPAINHRIASGIEFSYPPLPEQKAIAHILGSLDDKIELNRRMNETLEGMAQALFKSWFVDFDPVIDNILVKNMEKYPSPNLSQGERDVAGNEGGSSPFGRSGDEGSIFDGIPEEFTARAHLRQGYAGQAEPRRQVPSIGNKSSNVRKLFPDSFQPSELGPIPTGWEVQQVKDFGSVVCGKTPSKKNADYYGEDVPFIKIPDMHQSAWITDTSDGLSLEGAKSQAKKEIPANSICVSCIATVGKVVINSRASHTNQQINSVVPDRDCFRYYLYFVFSGMTKELHDLASGGSATLNLNTGNFSKIDVLLPSDEALESYFSVVDPQFQKMLANDLESTTLTKLRDTLLPKLISGELRVESLKGEG